MNYENNDMLTSPNLSYTSRDYTSIYNELMSSIPLLTKSWDPKDENDPGVVLIKLISMLGDMLSYNLDKNALEAFPRTVLQRANAQQIFRLVGYKMHWWRSARIEAKFTNANTYPIYISKYNTFSTKDASIMYTNINQITIPAGTYGDDMFTTELIQGTPITPVLKTSINPVDYNDTWHENYDYNINASDIVNDRIYLNYKNIDETSITLIDNDEAQFSENEWTQVKNINLSETMDKVFEFDVDEDNIPFIQLPSYWKEKYVVTKFKLFLVLSDGVDGEIEENMLTGINSQKCYVSDDNIDVTEALKQVSMYNTASTYGYNPETCSEARKEAEKYINTIDTLVVLKDFERAVRRIDSVANVIATDIQMDPHGDEMTNNQVNLYIVRKSDYNNLGANYLYATEGPVNTDELFKENVVGELQSYKTIPTDINVLLENYIDWIDWSVEGQIFLRKPINPDQNYDLMVRINDNLKNRFNCETLDFNEPINYMDVIECIMKTDKNIWHVDLNSAAIQYYKPKRLLNGNPTGFEIKDKYMIYDEHRNYTGYYITSLGCTQVELDKISEYDVYNNIYDTDLAPGYQAGADTDDLTQTTYINIERSNESKEIDENTDITPGGDGTGKNAGNRIVREDGADYVIGLFGLNEPREYEIYNKLIYDWTGVEPEFTGKVINTDDPNNIRIQEYDSNGNLQDTPYKLIFDSRLYLPDGSDAGEYLRHSYKQIEKLCSITENDRLTNSQIANLSEQEKIDLVNENKLRAVYEFINREYNEPTGKVIDKLTGEIFTQRGNTWYSTRRSYNEETGEILDTYGPVYFTEETGIIKEPACREDVTCQYIQFMDIKKDQTDFSFFLGQDCDGNLQVDSIGNIIEAYPIKPYSLYIYIDGDVEVLADTGSGQINGTPGLLNGQGTIDYSTGYVSFKLNVVPQTMKVMYTVNKFTYAKYTTFDTSKLFVRPEYIRSDTRK